MFTFNFLNKLNKRILIDVKGTSTGMRPSTPLPAIIVSFNTALISRKIVKNYKVCMWGGLKNFCRNLIGIKILDLLKNSFPHIWIPLKRPESPDLDQQILIWRNPGCKKIYFSLWLLFTNGSSKILWISRTINTKKDKKCSGWPIFSQ